MSIIADIRAGTKQVLDGVTGLAQTYSARPGSVGTVPAAWVDAIRVDLLHTAGVRQWSAEVDVVLVTGGFDNEDHEATSDTLTEAVVDAFTDAPHMAGANTVAEPVRTRSTVVDNGNGISFPAVVVTIGRIVYAEGR